MTACCAMHGQTSSLSAYDCFERGLTTYRLAPLPIQGERIVAPPGLWAAFSLRLDAGRLVEVRFSAATCTTLIACGQALVELATGRTLNVAGALYSAELLGLLQGIPRQKHNRGVLAIAAFRSALAAAHDSAKGRNP